MTLRTEKERKSMKLEAGTLKRPITFGKPSKTARERTSDRYPEQTGAVTERAHTDVKG